MSQPGLVISDQQTVTLLREALKHIEANDTFAAESVLEHILKGRPKEPDALQLMGLVRRAQGRPAEAEDFYRRSLAERPDQPHVHHNLGALLVAFNRNDEALVALSEAVRLRPDYVDAHINLARAYSNLGRHKDAERALRRALWLSPGNPLALQSLGGVLNDLNKPKEAEALLRKALGAETTNVRQIAALEHNLGVSFNLQDRFEEAVACFDSAQSKAPDMPLVDYNRATALQSLGRFEEAIDNYRRAVARAPLDYAAHHDLNDLLYRLDRDGEFLRSYDDAALLYPDVGEFPLEKAKFQFMRRDYVGARENFERAAFMLPASVTPHDGLALVLVNLGDLEGAIREQELALKMEPMNAPLWRNFAETLIRAGDAKRAQTAAEEAMKIDPMNQGAIATWGTALAVQEDPRNEELNNYESFVVPYALEPPQGYSDMESFNRDLDRYLDRLHQGKKGFLEQTLRGGTQTFGNLFGRGHDLVERLRVRIDEAVADFIKRMPEDGDHPLLKRRKSKFDYSASWSGRLHDCGFHTNHVHPKGWISSAYYVALPESVDDREGKQGWINFGEPQFDAGPKASIRRAVQPKVGTLVLFPSYMWHGTVPFHSRQSRTTIAFDVLPR